MAPDFNDDRCAARKRETAVSRADDRVMRAGGILAVHLRSPELIPSCGGHPSPEGDVSSRAKDGLPSVARSRMQAGEDGTGTGYAKVGSAENVVFAGIAA